MPLTHKLLRWAPAAFVLLLASASAAAADRPAWLEIPDQHVTVPANGAVSLTSDQVSYLVIHLNERSDQVAYARINTRINAEAANIVSTERTMEDGLVCSLDLKANPELALHAGRNSVEVSFLDRWNDMHYFSFMIQLPGSAGLRAGGAEPGSGGPVIAGRNRYALVIGIARYKAGGHGVANLPYADADAAAFHDFLLEPRGGNIPADHIVFLLNEDATNDAIRAALERLQRATTAGDVILIYLNMNGAYDPAAPDRKYVLAYDSDPEDLANTAIPVSDLPDMLSVGNSGKHVVVMADTCHDNGNVQQGRMPASPDNLVNLYLARAFAVNGQAALEASDVHQTSQAGDRWKGAGVFTYYLLKGLAGSADSNGDGTVTVRELFRYVQLKVSADTVDGQIPIYSEGHGAGVALAGVATARAIR